MIASPAVSFYPLQAQVHGARIVVHVRVFEPQHRQQWNISKNRSNYTYQPNRCVSHSHSAKMGGSRVHGSPHTFLPCLINSPFPSPSIKRPPIPMIRANHILPLINLTASYLAFAPPSRLQTPDPIPIPRIRSGPCAIHPK